MAAKKKKKKRVRQPSAANALRSAVAALDLARVERDAARATLANLSRPSGPHHIVDRSAAWMNTTLRKVQKRLLRIPGVVGVGLGSRARDGVQTSEPCISVLVTKKLTPDQLQAQSLRKIQKFIRVGRRVLPLDVVELGQLERQVAVGDDIGPANANHAGTLGVVARDTGNGSAVAVTAMHVSGKSEVPGGGVTAIPFCTPSRATNGGGVTFANLVRGTTSRIDAAKLQLATHQPPGGMIPGLGPIAGWRPLVFPGDLRTTVFMFGAVSGLQQGFIANTAVDLPAEGLESAILANISSQPGDSGSVMVDMQRFVLGFLVGTGNSQLGNLRVFCPAGLVFSELGCDIP